MDDRKRVIGYAAQRGITVDHVGSWGVTHKLTPRQARRTRKVTRQWFYRTKDRNAVVPF